jgi:hypothetical protein
MLLLIHEPWLLSICFSNGDNCQSHWSNLGCLWGAHPLTIAELCNVHTCCFISFLGKLISITDRLKSIIYNSSYLYHMQPLFIFSSFPNSHHVGRSPNPGLLLPKVSIYLFHVQLPYITDLPQKCIILKIILYNCTSNGFSCNFLDLAMKWSTLGIPFDKHSQPEYAGIEMICMNNVHFNISITNKLGNYQ